MSPEAGRRLLLTGLAALREELDRLRGVRLRH
jgi:hypothetical protein